MTNYYKPGTWNVICDLCGVKFKSDQIRQRWDGFLVCPNDFEARHPLDFIRTREERTGVPFTRLEPPDNFITPVYIEATQGRADIGKADVAKAGVIINT
jgi:hypothetical protein